MERYFLTDSHEWSIDRRVTVAPALLAGPLLAWCGHLGTPIASEYVLYLSEVHILNVTLRVDGALELQDDITYYDTRFLWEWWHIDLGELSWPGAHRIDFELSTTSGARFDFLVDAIFEARSSRPAGRPRHCRSTATLRSSSSPGPSPSWRCRRSPELPRRRGGHYAAKRRRMRSTLAT